MCPGCRSTRCSKYIGERFSALQAILERYTPTCPDLLATPYFQGDHPRSLLIDEIEAIWRDIAERGDGTAFEAKLRSLRAMEALFSP